jgi:hypothetical protein
MIEFQMMWLWLQARVEPMRHNPERGDVVQTAIMIGLFAAGAIAVVGILVKKANDAANSVNIK